MSTSTPAPASAAPEVEYPDSDGEPMAENTLQFQWIVTLQGGVDVVFRDDPDVFVAGDLLWYPVQGNNTIRAAPDTMVVFGRPKGYRGSYRQWEEAGIAPQVVFEVLSPGNRAGELKRKFEFYDRYGVEEYYLYDPDNPWLEGWLRVDGTLQPITPIDGWVSPRLGIRFDLSGAELRVIGPDGRPFATYLEMAQRAEEERQRAEAERRRAEAERRNAEQHQHLAQQERQRAEEQQHLAEQERQLVAQERHHAEQQQRLAEQERQRAERLAAQLRALGIEPEG